MKILINMATLKKGGGQNVALNFLASISNIEFDDVEFYFFVADGSDCHQFLLNAKNDNFRVVPSSPLKRIIFELMCAKSVMSRENVDIIYTYFGIGFFRTKIPQVSGSADSNLYFPEIDFWSHYKGLDRLKKKVVDSYRIWGLKRASAIIFENKAMESRSKKLFNLKQTTFIKPSINLDTDIANFNSSVSNKHKGLFLCGWQLNKNIMIIPEIAFYLKKEGIPFEFVITAPIDNSLEHIRFTEKVKYFDVEDYINLTGTVKKQDLTSLYENINFVFLLSKLESFSNNIIEAWYHKRLLIISDEIWSKSICKESAFYVQRDDAVIIASALGKIIKDKKLQNLIIEKASIELLSYPTINERTVSEINYLKQIYECS